MKLEFEGRVWQLDLEALTVSQGEAIGEYTGLAPTDWYRSLFNTDSLAWLKSMRCFYWVMCQQNGVEVGLQTSDFAPLALLKAFNEACAAEMPAEASQEEADPTKPGAGSAGDSLAPNLSPGSPRG